VLGAECGQAEQPAGSLADIPTPSTTKRGYCSALASIAYTRSRGVPRRRGRVPGGATLGGQGTRQLRHQDGQRLFGGQQWLCLGLFIGSSATAILYERM
jgi:hypothetical protein